MWLFFIVFLGKDKNLQILPVVMCSAGKVNLLGMIWIKDSNVEIYFLTPLGASELEKNNRTELHDQLLEIMNNFQCAQLLLNRNVDSVIPEGYYE